MNGEGLVVPVLLGAEDVDVGVDARFGHGCEIGDLSGLGLGLGLVNKGGGAQDREVRNRRTQGYEGAQYQKTKRVLMDLRCAHISTTRDR